MRCGAAEWTSPVCNRAIFAVRAAAVNWRARANGDDGDDRFRNPDPPPSQSAAMSFAHVAIKVRCGAGAAYRQARAIISVLVLVLWKMRGTEVMCGCLSSRASMPGAPVQEHV